MKLWFARTSPFARKVRIAAHELGFAEAIRLEEVNPWTDANLRSKNPLCKVPTLELSDGTTLFESYVICDYLDSLRPERHLIPSRNLDRCQALLLQGLADGAMTAAGRLFADERRCSDERSEMMMRRFEEVREAALDWLDQQHLQATPRIGEISAAAYLGYLDFRWPERDWRSTRCRLATWFAEFGERPSMQNTRHAPT